MSNIIIIGGGISGLSTLHFLKKKYAGRSEIDIKLLEKNDYAGGTIRSIERNGCFFETGPDGFLNNKPRTLDFIEEIGLRKDLIKARPEAKVRFISLKNRLYPLPANPKDFLISSLLNPLDKMRILGEILIPKCSNPQESIFDFGQRRLGKKFAKIFLDAMVSGIYGGDAHQLNLKAAFPRIYALEQEYGSLFKAMFALKGKGGMPEGVLTSLNNGMGEIVQILSQKYKENILLKTEVKSMAMVSGGFKVESSKETFWANEIFLCSPAYSTASIVKNSNPKMAALLEGIYYAPMAVVGLVFALKDFKQKPRGFGFLVPSSEKKAVLGVLFESNIFPGRCPEDHILFRVMIGGSHFPDILKKSREELTQMAVHEIKNYFFIPQAPKETFFVVWPRAIPQYDAKYVQILSSLEEELKDIPNLHVVSNFLKGIAMNDCIENAYQVAQKSYL